MLVAVTGSAPGLENTRRNRAFAKLGRWALHYELPLLVTAPGIFSAHPERLTGWTLHQRDAHWSWRFATFRNRESVVYDAMYLADLKAYRNPYRRLLHQLQVRQVPCFNPVLPAKDKVYRALQKRSADGLCLPKTWFDVTPNGVVKLLKASSCLWLKPTYGSGGRNMMCVRSLGKNRYEVVAERFYGERVHREMSRAALCTMITIAQRHRRYMAQEHVSLLQTADGRKADIRVTVQRDYTGHWKLTALTGRCGGRNSILTNYHAGGQTTSLTAGGRSCHQWLTDVGMVEADLVRAEKSALAAAKRLEILDAHLGLLGVDVGRAEDGQQFVYDCNGRPGRDILTDAEVNVFMRNVAGYGRYLHEQMYAKEPISLTEQPHPDDPSCAHLSSQ